MKILFLVPYPVGKSPSQRFRFEQYFSLLLSHGHTFEVQSFLDERGWASIYSKGKAWEKFTALLRGFWRRFRIIFAARQYDAIFIHRELAPIGPPLLEWLLPSSEVPIIYDFDDAIWMTDQVDESQIASVVRWRKKVGFICRIASRVSCGNEYLANYARKFNASVLVNPTTIDTQYHRRLPRHSGGKLTIGWTGSHSTLKYLDQVVPAIRTLEQEFHDLTFLVIADRAPDLGLTSMSFVSWNEATEIDELTRLDIGIMPLPDDDWSKGKCGFKALQYMALGIPAVVSPVGVNTSIVRDGENGFWCQTTEDWVKCLSELLKDPQLRERIGRAGQSTVENYYSVASNSANFLSLFPVSAMMTKANT